MMVFKSVFPSSVLFWVLYYLFSGYMGPLGCPMAHQNQCASKLIYPAPIKPPPTCTSTRISSLVMTTSSCLNEELQSFDSFPEFTPPLVIRYPHFNLFSQIFLPCMAILCSCLELHHLPTGCLLAAQMVSVCQHLTIRIHPPCKLWVLKHRSRQTTPWVWAFGGSLLPCPSFAFLGPLWYSPPCVVCCACIVVLMLPRAHPQRPYLCALIIFLFYPGISIPTYFFNPENCMPSSNVTLSVFTFLITSSASVETKTKQQSCFLILLCVAFIVFHFNWLLMYYSFH